MNQDAAVRDYQEFLEKTILKLNYKSFTQIVLLGSSTFIPFMQLKTSDRRAIIEDLLDIEVFSVMNQLLKGRVAINKDTTGTVDISLGLSKGEKENLEFLIERLKQNKFTPATNIPVFSPSKLKTEPVDAVIIIGAAYTEEIVGIIKKEFPDIRQIAKVIGAELIKVNTE